MRVSRWVRKIERRCTLGAVANGNEGIWRREKGEMDLRVVCTLLTLQGEEQRGLGVEAFQEGWPGTQVLRQSKQGNGAARLWGWNAGAENVGSLGTF